MHSASSSPALAAASTASADVQITMRDGRVSVIAKDATLRQILAEWAKVGQTKILNADRVPGAPLTLQLNNVPETQALDTLLRTVSGYVASPRAEIVSEPLAVRSHRHHADARAADVGDVWQRRAAGAVPADAAGIPAVPAADADDDGDDQQDAPNRGARSSISFRRRRSRIPRRRTRRCRRRA